MENRLVACKKAQFTNNPLWLHINYNYWWYHKKTISFTKKKVKTQKSCQFITTAVHYVCAKTCVKRTAVFVTILAYRYQF